MLEFKKWVSVWSYTCTEGVVNHYRDQFSLSQQQHSQSEGRLQNGKGNLMHTVRHTVNKLLKPRRLLLSMHKPFELVFLICLGWQPFMQAEHDITITQTVPLCQLFFSTQKHKLWHHSLIIPNPPRTPTIRLSLGYGWTVLKQCSRSSDDLLLSTQPAPSVFVFHIRTVNFLRDTSEL